MIKFPSIESFTHYVYRTKSYAEHIGVPVETLPKLKFRGTVKLHGTNAGVHVPVEGDVLAQSRNDFLHLKNTNMGFLTFVNPSAHGDLWKDLAKQFLELNGITTQTEPVTIFGEWVGQGIQKKCSVGQCPKHFVIFQVFHGDTPLPAINGIHNNDELIYNITQIPTYEVEVDPSDFQAASDKLNELTAAIEEECPWAKAMFDITGIGEGLVWVPEGNPGHTEIWFKTKGQLHKVRAAKDVAPVDVEKVNSIKECVDLILTENRMEQMITDHKLEMVPQSIGKFLQVLSADIIKEESMVIEANGLTWKEVGKLVQFIARTWFLQRITQITMSQ